MAKPKVNPMLGMFKRTEGEEPGAQPLNTSNETTRPVGVYLSREDKARLQQIADKEGLKRHALLQYAILHFLREYEDGRIQLPTQTVKTIQRP